MNTQDSKKTSKHTINYSTPDNDKKLVSNKLPTRGVIPANFPLIDSLSIKIKLDDCKVLDKRLTSDTSIRYTDLPDGDQYDDVVNPPVPYVVVKNGITVRLTLVQIPITKQTGEKVPTWFINTVLTSKLLLEDYFIGISTATIDKLFNTFLDFEIFSCEKDVFLDSLVSDIDVCINRYTDGHKNFIPILEHLQNQTGTKKHLTKLFNDPDGQSLMFNQRHHGKPSLPFVKLYNKELELLGKSAEFWNAYLFKHYAGQIRNLTRIECTIRNYAHKKRLVRFGILPNFKNLRELLEVSAKDLYRFIIFSIESYIEKRTRVKSPTLSPTDHLIFELIQNSVVSGYDFNAILSIVDSFKGSNQNVTDVSRTRMRKKLTSLYDLLIEKELKIRSKATQNSHILSYLNFIGLSK